MRPFNLIIAICAVVTATGCAHWNGDSAKTPYGTHTADADTGPITSHNTTSTEAVSDFQRCVDQRAGMGNVEAYCQMYLSSARPGQFPPYYGYGVAPSYYAGQYGTYSGVPYAR